MVMIHLSNHISITFTKPQGNLAQKQINGKFEMVYILRCFIIEG